MEHSLHALAPHNLPFFITAPGDTDTLLVVMGVSLAALILAMIRFPDFGTPLREIAASLAKGFPGKKAEPDPDPQPIEPLPVSPHTEAEDEVMLELLFCAMLTILPDYLYRRFAQGKRLGTEITLFTVWYELRWGITACLLLTISLITVVFYFHPSTSNVTSFYRTVPVLPETGGRVVEIYVGLSEEVEAGQPLFRLDSSMQEATLATAQQPVAEIDAQIILAQADLITADGRIAEAQSAFQQAQDELDTKVELRTRNCDVVPEREIERLQNLVDGRTGSLSVAQAAKQSLEANINAVLPAQRASAVAQAAEAQTQLDKMTIYAGVMA